MAFWHDWERNNSSVGYRPASPVAPPAGSDYTADLNHYFKNEVRLRKENIQKSLKITIRIVNRILEYINELDPRFSHERVGVGSYWQGLKVEKPDEFDISVPLNFPDGHEWVEDTGAYFNIDPCDNNKLINTYFPLPAPSLGYTRFLTPNLGPEWTEFTFKGYFIPKLVRNKFTELLREAVWKLNKTGIIIIILFIIYTSDK